MKLQRPYKSLLLSILSGTYTPPELRDFVKLCRDLAFAVIVRRKLLGKLNPQLQGLDDDDLIQDCLADLFERNEESQFFRIRRFFETSGDFDSMSDEAVVAHLRRLVVGAVHQSLPRIYSGADPVFGKILRNMRLFLDRGEMLKEVIRFNEPVLVPLDADPLFGLPPMSPDELQQRWWRKALISDHIPRMMQKIHELLVEQSEVQRVIPLMAAVALIKEVYVLAWRVDGDQAETPYETESAVEPLVRRACRQLGSQLRATYVGKGKCTEEQFQGYLNAVEDVLAGRTDGRTNYEVLAVYRPDVTPQEYRRKHRKVLEYFVRRAKVLLKKKLGGK